MQWKLRPDTTDLKMIRQQISRLLVVSVALLGGSVKADEQAVASVDEFHGLLLEVMQAGDALGFQDRKARLKTMVSQKFDMETIGNVVLNRHWRDLSQQQQQSFIEQFIDLSSATYASRFDNYSQQQFQTLGFESMSAGRVMVRTEITSPTMTTVKLDYILQPDDSSWKIIAAIADGVNDLAVKRTEYTAIMNAGGFDQLLAELTAQTQALNGSQ
ncbi:MAG: ABC transporter substrate-binding protein [Pseudomonadales bacterium]|nr:ABC transporter substrate-binding protein [Pseudomonadales bacterium]